uniref:Uncharacterized protein n=1 Tax=Fusarium oxysporum (strain Fo5176) TaxID=660025 RepID=A0A0D2XLG3_FUSOF
MQPIVSVTGQLKYFRPHVSSGHRGAGVSRELLL